jgi:hypothetical protein
MKLKTMCIAIAFGVCAPALALAQLSMPSFGSKPAAGSGDLIGQQSQIVHGYVAANKDVLIANAQMADALGLKDLAATLKAQADALVDGSTKGDFDKAQKAVSDAAKQEQEAEAKAGANLDAASKQKFSEGLGSLGLGVLHYAALSKPIQSFASGLKGASMLDLPKLQTGSFIVTNFPTGLKNLTDSLQSAISFAKSHDIPVPADATQAMPAS